MDSLNLTSSYAFQESDIQLLQTGNFADGIVKCQDRTWKVHRALLASRLKFFQVAFYGSFAEAISGEVNFPEADPESVEVMLRHLYRQEVDVKDLKTPAFCVRCWRFADYLNLESLKAVAIATLGQHFDALALLASNVQGNACIRPKWMTFLFEAFREVSVDESTKPLYCIFATFLLVTRFQLLKLPKTLDFLKHCHGVNKELLKLLAWDFRDDRPVWIPRDIDIEQLTGIARPFFHGSVSCPGPDCIRGESLADQYEIFYNPFPLDSTPIGKFVWCRKCVHKINEERRWPWRSGGGWKEGEKISLEAWSW
ncbi:hypothetical protein J7T55_009723 [Diaporthe amygdali]|uniref:uncharacterized protein n=1 Tax=Phomopsis amygdali TaxID=1214568 RepID=UPI0022FF17FD|nr:uncharacterized protein J7T55_009723 [Diaporthe amygdali]KAJ0116573.1 hypothetical protein J7T55_009723 [Diaporthe amygdali]